MGKSFKEIGKDTIGVGMKKPLIIGVDIGGSHISCGTINLNTLELGSISRVKLDSKMGKTKILTLWADAINEVVAQQDTRGVEINIGFAIPGPFDYKNGIALFDKDLDKYPHLYSVNVSEELPEYLNKGNYTFRFINDAVAFALGSVSHMQLGQSRCIVLTLGTGLGSSFVKNGVPLLKADNIPDKGWLWNKKFNDGIADDYFSTRWFTQRFSEITGEEISGVRELVESGHREIKEIFDEFATNLSDFLSPYIKAFKPDTLLLGGNITKANFYFLPQLNVLLEDFNVDIRISTIGEEAAIIGSAQLFEPGFWQRK